MTIIVWFIPSHRSHSLLLLFLWYVVCGNDRKRKHIHTSSSSLSLALLPSLLLLLNKHFLHTNTVVSFNDDLTSDLTSHLFLVAAGTCGPNEVQCKDGECIQAEWTCDTEADCPDRSDEVNCREYYLSFILSFPQESRERCSPNIPACLYLHINKYQNKKLNNEINK